MFTITEADAALIASQTAGRKQPFTDLEVFMISDMCPDRTIMPDFQRYLYTCSIKGANPLLNDCHMEYKETKSGSGKFMMIIVPHVHLYRKLAALTTEMDWIQQVPATDEFGGFYVETTIQRKGRSKPFVVRAYGKEFSGQLHGKMPYHMCAKVSENIGYKIAFPEAVDGMDPADEGFSNLPSQILNGAPEERQPTQFPVVEKQPGPVVVEKAAEKQAEKAPADSAPAPAAANTAPAPEQAPPPAVETDPLKAEYRRLAAEIVKMGTTAKDLKAFNAAYHGGKPASPQAAIDGILKLQKHLVEGGKNALADFNFNATVVGKDLSGRREPLPNQPPTSHNPGAAQAGNTYTVETSDPAIIDARQKIVKQLGWGPGHRLEIAARYMADHMLENPNSIEDYLKSVGLYDGPFGKQEAFLSIARHVPDSAQQILDFTKKSGMPFSELESKIDAIVAKPIRYSDELLTDQVTAALKIVIAGEGK
jgi:hypothetical protein